MSNKYQETLREIYSLIPNAPTECLIISDAGLAIAALRRVSRDSIEMPDLADEEYDRPALGSAMWQLGERGTNDLHSKPVESLLLQSEEGIIFQIRLNDDHLLMLNWANELTIEVFAESWGDLEKVVGLLNVKLSH